MALNRDRIDEIIRESIEVKNSLIDTMTDNISSCGESLANAVKSGKKILLCGNGGSAAEAQHFASELIGRFWQKDRPAIPAIALTTDSSVLTSVSNDFGFEDCFVRQIEALGKPGDVLITISTSGNSLNIIRAAQAAKRSRMLLIGMLGARGGELIDMVDDYVLVPSESTPRIQECHHMLSHIFAECIEAELYCKED
jgi:D-sedoheptulose 7-phosphate isomerase